jgi:hypothetical protein
MKLNDEDLAPLIEKWQRILRLQDWDLRLQLVQTSWRKTGDIKIDAEDRKAVLLVNAQNPRQENLEEVVIHELIHLKLWSLDQMLEQLLIATFGNDPKDPKYAFAQAQFMTNLESTVQDLTKSYLSLGGEDKTLSFGRVQQQVEAEIQLGSQPET